MEYLYYEEQYTDKHYTVKSRVCRKEIIREEDQGYILRGLFTGEIAVFKKDLCSYSALGDIKIRQYCKETPELLERLNIQDLEYEYYSKVREFLETDDHETMKKVIKFLDEIFKGGIVNKVEVFNCVEILDDCGSVNFSINNFNSGIYNPSLRPEDMELKTENYIVRTISQQRAVSRFLPEEDNRREVRRLLDEGFTLREERFSPPDPYITFYEKVKKFVIADKFVDSVFNDVEKHNHNTDFSKRSCNLLIIDQTNDINKLTYELNSQSEVIDNYREEYQRLEKSHLAMKRMNLFRRIFQWKNSLNGK